MLTLDEQELSVLIEPLSQNAKIYTSIPGKIRKLDNLCSENPTDWKCTGVSKIGGDVIGKSYECKRNLILFRAKSQTRELTDEQRAEIAKRLKQARESNAANA